MLKSRGRPKSPDSKVAISLRLSPDTLARWKATGSGWQTRMAKVLAFPQKVMLCKRTTELPRQPIQKQSS